MITPGKHQLQVVDKFVGVPARLIGDSMGVGKTLSAILLDREERARRLYKSGRTLIVCQKGGLAVWKWHLEDQGVKSSRILVIDPKNRGIFDSELAAGAHNYDYYIMHWDVLIRLEHLTRHVIPIKIIKWDHLIMDEVHLGKNRNAKRTSEMKRIRATYKTGCSGTPADNKPQDFWSVLHWLYPKDYSSYWRFYDRYLEWETHSQNGYRVVTGVKNMDEFHTKIGSYYIRRKLDEVVDSMPEKTRGEIRVELSPRQRRDYDAMHKYQVARIGEANEELLVTYKIAMYVRLQQMSLGTCELDWTKYEKAVEKYGHLQPYSQYVPKDQCQPKNMPTGPVVRIGEPSPKIDAVMEKIDEAMDADESIVVFSQFTGVVDLVEARCLKAKYPFSKVTGKMTNQAERDAAVADFQARKTRVFAGTIGAAGTTITLTAAHTLIFTDRKWNPSANEQAEDRIWRMNQPNACRIWDIVADDTIDDERLKKIWMKARWVNEVVNVPTHLKDIL